MFLYYELTPPVFYCCDRHTSVYKPFGIYIWDKPRRKGGRGVDFVD